MKKFALCLIVLMFALTACQKKQSSESTTPQGQSSSSKSVVKIDGSSTVFPVSESVAEEFRKVDPQVSVLVGESGTGGGFKKFINKETDITGASRPVKPEEAEALKKNGIAYVELPIAYDGLTVVVHPKNTFVDSLKIEELQKIWKAEGAAQTWDQVRSTFPKEKIVLFGPGAASGTFDYFTEVVNGKSKSSRQDYTASEDDNVLVQGVSGSPYALGYFGYAYFKANANKLKAVSIDAGKGAVLPSEKTIAEGTYKPLSRPLFIYVSVESLNKPEVAKFVDFFVQQSAQMAHETGYVPFTAEEYAAIAQRLKSKTPGSVFASYKGLIDIKKMAQTPGQE